MPVFHALYLAMFFTYRCSYIAMFSLRGWVDLQQYLLDFNSNTWYQVVP